MNTPQTDKSNTWILVVDDETAHRRMIRAMLENFGYSVLETDNGDDAVEVALREKPSLVIMDVRMPKKDGITALKEMRSQDLTMPVLIMTAYGTIESAVDAVKSGAYDYLQKPIDIADLENAVNNCLSFTHITQGKDADSVISTVKTIPGFIIKSPQMTHIFDLIQRVAPSEASVLITGESGTGKEVIADAIHTLSHRADKPYIKINCAALHEQLLESELFGHERGAFTGAHDQRKGRFELADTGTLMLDEIGDMAPTTQAKILRVLQSGTFERLGGTKTLQANVRVIAATNHDLKKRIEEGGFRKDLYFRLSVVPIHIPPLRERRDEIPLLAQHFLTSFAEKNRRNIHSIDSSAMDILTRYNWPGNVRELENVIERCVIMSLSDTISSDILPTHILHDMSVTEDDDSSLTMIEQAERELISQAMVSCNGNRTRAAEQLGMSRRSLYNKLNRYGINKDLGRT